NVAPARSCESLLTVDLHNSTQPISIAAGSAQGDGKPICRSAVIQKHQWLSAQRSTHNIHPAIIIQIAESCPTPGNRCADACIRSLEAPVVVERQQRRLLV